MLDTLLPVLEKEGWSHAQIAEDWGISLGTLLGHLTQEIGMPVPSKHDYPALIREYDERLANGEAPKDIRATLKSRGVNWGTFQNRRTQAKKAHQSIPEAHQDTPKVHHSTPAEPELWTVHPGTPDHLSTPGSTDAPPANQYTQEHHRISEHSGVPQHTEIDEVHPSKYTRS